MESAFFLGGRSCSGALCKGDVRDAPGSCLQEKSAQGVYPCAHGFQAVREVQGLAQIKPVGIHDFGPGGHKVIYEFLRRVISRVQFRQCAEPGV